MNKTIYIRDEDISVWDRAKQLAGDKLAPVIVEGLKKFITAKEAELDFGRGFERLVVKYSDADDNGIPKIKAFRGKWIFPPTKPLEAGGGEDHTEVVAVAVTAKGNYVFLYWTAFRDGESYRTFEIFDSLTAATKNESVRYAALRSIEEQGIPVEELDI